MDALDFTTFQHDAPRYRSLLDECLSETRLLEKGYIHASMQACRDDRLLARLTAAHDELTSTRTTLIPPLSVAVAFLEARRVPVEPEIISFDGEDYAHEHTGRYHYAYILPDDGKLDNSAIPSIQRCQKSYANGRREDNLDCLFLNKKASDRFMIKVVTEAQLKISHVESRYLRARDNLISLCEQILGRRIGGGPEIASASPDDSLHQPDRRERLIAARRQQLHDAEAALRKELSDRLSPSELDAEILHLRDLAAQEIQSLESDRNP